MNTFARENYLETEVLTATPQKLRLMLIDGAIRTVQSAQRHWQADEHASGHGMVLRAQAIVTELLGGLNTQDETPLVKQIESIYWFVLRSLAEANATRDPDKLAGVLKVFEVERETWRQVCEQNGGQESGLRASADVCWSTEAQGPNIPAFDLPETDTCTGFSLDA